MIRYEGPGCYRFLDTSENIIYVGSSKNIQRRLNSHFGGKQGHLGKSVYNQVARVEVCKCIDYPTALALEQVLISKYRPRYNTKDKSSNINYKPTKNMDYYESLENWKLYYKFKEYDKDKIEANKKDDLKAMFIAAVVFILAIGLFIF